MAEIQITMRLFGAFRKYGENVSFAVPAGCTAAAVKEKLAEVLKLSDKKLLMDSVLANDNEIIDSGAVLSEDSHLAILPPVCGG
ncbi:MAG: MoaD/ThiS family protein [Alphaproteobacteria bacterium]|nr:MoaD/ThiS family protein [Alphaproteobacteria bacterium]